MLRGAFKNHAGLVLPNNITLFGRMEVLRMAFAGNQRGVVTAAGANFYVGLCLANPGDGLLLEDIAEPTIGVNGYARVAVSRDATGWTTDGFVNGEAFIESKDLAFTAVGGNFDKPISRLFLCTSPTALTGDLIALSAAMPAALTITPLTLVTARTFNYDVFLG